MRNSGVPEETTSTVLKDYCNYLKGGNCVDLKINTKIHPFLIFFLKETQLSQNLRILFTTSPYFSKKSLTSLCLYRAEKKL